MKSVVCHGPKDLRIEESETPVAGKSQALIEVEAGGICGSDLHYYNDGGFGAIRIKEPMILGHEVAGRVAALGEEVAGLSEGDLVAKEIQMLGNFRFHDEFNWAAKLIGDRRISLDPLLTGVHFVDNAVAAFEAANDRRSAMKVQLSFSEG